MTTEQFYVLLTVSTVEDSILLEISVILQKLEVTKSY